MLLSCSTWTQNLSEPDQLLVQIQKDGAKTIVQQLPSGKGTAWDHTMDKISNGDRRWLSVAEALRSGTDAGNTQSIYYAVSKALLKAPDRVLRLISDQFPMEAICTVPDIEPTPTELRTEITQATSALALVRDPALITRRDECLASFEKLPK